MDAIAAASRMAGRIFSQHLPAGATTTIVALMQPMRRSWATGILPIAGLITMLLALAALQLRWSAKIGEAERDRLQQNLQRSTAGFQSNFARDLLSLCGTMQVFEPSDPAALEDRLFDRYAVWRHISGHPGLISGIYLWQPSGEQHSTLFELNPQSRTLEPVSWPVSLRMFSTRTASGGRVSGLPRRPRRWVWDERVPVLIHPLYISGTEGNAQHSKLYGYLFIVFSRQYFEQVYLPELGRRYFPVANSFIFQLIENNNHGERHVVYQSGEHVPAGIFPHPDAVINLLDESALYRSGERPTSSGTGGGRASGPVLMPVPVPVLVPVLVSASPAPALQIAVRHRSGSVDAAVTALRRRDLAVSLAVLVALAVSLITILVSTRRARKFAQLQMEFASGVSHELRTPLAVICSAAENLADGVVTEGGRVRDYGVLIHKEGQRLSGMVDHILDFARLRSAAHSYELETVSVTNLIEEALANARPLVQSAGISVEVDTPPNLPWLLTNASALGQCLQNLLSNAVKYGSGGRRIVIAASQAREDGEERVLIGVKDFGAGIAEEELPLIWDPFYRGSAARDSQIRGTGLGLSLTREMVETLGGQVTVESSVGKGSVFTLHVPIAPDASTPGVAPQRSRSV